MSRLADGAGVDDLGIGAQDVVDAELTAGGRRKAAQRLFDSVLSRCADGTRLACRLLTSSADRLRLPLSSGTVRS